MKNLFLLLCTSKVGLCASGFAFATMLSSSFMFAFFVIIKNESNFLMENLVMNQKCFNDCQTMTFANFSENEREGQERKMNIFKT